MLTTSLHDVKKYCLCKDIFDWEGITDDGYLTMMFWFVMWRYIIYDTDTLERMKPLKIELVHRSWWVGVKQIMAD